MVSTRRTKTLALLVLTSACADCTLLDFGPPPDLAVRLSGPYLIDVIRGGGFSLDVTVRNNGDGIADATILRIYRSSDQSVDTDDTVVETEPRPVNPISAGPGRQFLWRSRVSSAGRLPISGGIRPCRLFLAKISETT